MGNSTMIQFEPKQIPATLLRVSYKLESFAEQVNSQDLFACYGIYRESSGRIT